MRALITGDAGFVGRHMRAGLEAAGHEVLGVDPAHGLHSRTTHLGIDCRRYFDDRRDHFDLVVHCAAVVGGRLMIDGDPLTLAVEDLSIDAALFKWAMQTRPGAIVYFSSSAAYPTFLQTDDLRTTQLAEDDIRHDRAKIGMPDQTYGWVKLTGERLALEANRAGILTHVFRPFSGYGHDQDVSYPFPAFVARGLAGNGRTADYPFDVWGDGEQARDFVHIDDVIETVMAVVGGAEDVGPVNIGTGIRTTFNELAWQICTALGYEPFLRHHPDKPVGVANRVADVTKMHRFHHHAISLVQGIQMALNPAD